MSRWVKDEDTGAYYYYYSNGEMATGWQKLDGEWYYFYDDGSMARDTMVKGYYVNDDGQWTKDERSREIIDGNGDHFYYYIGPKEKAVTGWNKIGDRFHYYNYPYGSMKRNDTIDGFYIDNYGDIVDGTGWIKDEYSGEFYYFSDGKMTYNDTFNGYHLNSHGKMVTGTGWIFVDSWWYYLDGNEKVVTDWLYDQGNWYYLYPQGSMAKGWIQVNGEWYYLNSSGEMVTGWTKYGDSWYYLNDDGAMAHDITIDGWYVDNDGKWDPNKDDESGNSQETSNTETNTLMACDTGDRNVDIAFTRWYDTIIPGKKYADDPRYSAISVAAFQNKLLYMSEQGIDISQLSADELDKLFEDEANAQASATDAMAAAGTVIAKNAGIKVVKGVGKAGKLSRNEIDELIEEIGGSIKNHPLRQEYENAVKDLCNYEAELRAQGLSQKEIAETLYKARRDLGVKYKNLTPAVLREYIYEVNMERYGDELGASFDFLVNKYSSECETMDEVYEAIIKSSQRPNSNVDKLLQNFKEWLIKKNQ